MLKAKWLKMKNTGAARYVYTVVGTAKEIAEYVENQGEYCRFLQDDGTIGEEETATPVFYSTRLVGKNPTLRYDADNERYRAEMSFEDACIMDAVNNAFNPTVNRNTQPADNEEEDPDADLNESAAAKKPAGSKRSLSKKNP